MGRRWKDIEGNRKNVENLEGNEGNGGNIKVMAPYDRHDPIFFMLSKMKDCNIKVCCVLFEQPPFKWRDRFQTFITSSHV